MFEHKPWIGSSYRAGINRQRIAIMGFSHHYNPDEEDDQENFTIDTLNIVIAGKEKSDIQFFNQIRNYFGSSDHDVFWKQVMFFNYLPICVGTVEDKYGYGTEKQHEKAKERFLRLLKTHRPHKILVFTTKGWNALPPTQEEKAEDGECQPLGVQFPKFSFGTYVEAGQTTIAYGLRHPQFANAELMQQATQHIISMPALT